MAVQAAVDWRCVLFNFSLDALAGLRADSAWPGSCLWTSHRRGVGEGEASVQP